MAYMEESNLDEANKSSFDQQFLNSEQFLKIISDKEKKEFWLLEYQSVISQFTRYVGLYFLVFVVYLCIQGMFFFTIILSEHNDLLKEIRMPLLIFAIVCCILFFFCIVVASTVVQNLKKRKERVLTKLGIIDEVDDEFSIGNATSLVYSIFNFFLLILFVLLLLGTFFNLGWLCMT